MKTTELTHAIETICKHVNVTDTGRMLDLANQVKDASARHLKKSREVMIWHAVRRGPVRGYEDVFEWVKCDSDGNALTPTGRVMTGKHDVIAYR